MESLIGRYPRALPLWALRLLLAILLLFGSDILLWTNPDDRSLPAWGVLIIGYLALSTLMLDLAARFRVRDVYGAMALFGIYGLLAAALLHPETALADAPRTIATRALGGHATLGLYGFGLFLVLLKAPNRRYVWMLLGWSLWLGFYWGIWARWSPDYSGYIDGAVSLETMLTAAGIVLAAALAVYVIAARIARAIVPDDLCLRQAEWWGLILVLLLFFMGRAIEETLDPAAVPIIALLIALSYAILWFHRSDYATPLLAHHLPPGSPRWLWIVLAAGIFAGSAAIAYELRLLDILGYSQYSFMELAFVTAGFVWYPLLTAVLGVRAVDNQVRTGKLG